MLKKFKNLLLSLFNKKDSVDSLSAKTWTTEEVERLVAMVKSGCSKDEMQKRMGRTLSSLNYKLAQLYTSSSSKVLKKYVIRNK